MIDFILHLDQHLRVMIDTMGAWTYLILFLIVFCETGLVVTPFLPGDSLLFTVGALCGLEMLNPIYCTVLLMVAANSGDALNYFVGKKLGARIFTSDNSRWLNKRHLIRTHEFYEKYGGKTIVFARFVPIIRTFAPFVAGIGKMTFARFAAFSVGGGFFWVSSFIALGYWFGNSEIVKKNFTLVILAIIVISVLPAVVEFIKSYRTQGNN